MRKLSKTFAIGALATFMFAVASFLPINQVTVNAQDNLICKLFPFIGDIDITSGLCGGDAGQTASSIGEWLKFGLSLIFIGIIIIAVVSIIKAAIEYIRSEGDEGKVQEASKSIKSVFIGIGALIVGLVGLAIVLTVIGADESLNTPDTPDNAGIVDNFLNSLSN